MRRHTISTRSCRPASAPPERRGEPGRYVLVLNRGLVKVKYYLSTKHLIDTAGEPCQSHPASTAILIASIRFRPPVFPMMRDM